LFEIAIGLSLLCSITSYWTESSIFLNTIKRVNIYLSGDAIQAMLRNCVWPLVRQCERLNRRAAATQPPRCLVGHTCVGTHQFAASNNYLKR